jgi:signal peptidase II
MKRPAWPGLFALSAGLILLDRLTKGIVFAADLNEPVEVIPGFFRLVKVWNTGLAFGTLSEASARIMNPAVIVIGAAAILWILHLLLFQRQGRGLTVCFHLLLAGAAGNVYDRIKWGGVLDFLEFHLGRFTWPAFNVADSCITIGLGLLVWDMVSSARK